MKYKITFYRKGMKKIQAEKEAKSHLDALKQVQVKAFTAWTHAVVKGKTTRRFTNDYKVIKNTPKFYKTTSGTSFAIMVMLGSVVEFHRYYDQEERDKAFERAVACTESTPAEFAKTDKELKDITVSTTETKDSKSGLTEKKTLSGSAKHATWTDSLTRTNTGKSSGKSKLGVSAEDEWLLGSKASPSKPGTKTLWAKVLKIPTEYAKWPGTNPSMKKMEGKIIRVTYSASMEKPLYHGNGWLWLAEWLEFIKEPLYTATVKNIKSHTEGSFGGNFVGSMRRYIGKTYQFTKHTSSFNGLPYYRIVSCPIPWNFAEEWLAFSDKNNYAKLPESGMSSEEIEKTVKHYMKYDDKLKFTYGPWDKLIDPTAV